MSQQTDLVYAELDSLMRDLSRVTDIRVLWSAACHLGGVLSLLQCEEETTPQSRDLSGIRVRCCMSLSVLSLPHRHLDHKFLHSM